MKYIYLIEYRQLNRTDRLFDLYRTEAFSSLKKAKASVENSIECNKGFDVDNDNVKPFRDMGFVQVTDYSSTANTEDKLMRLRLVITKVELR